MKQHLILFVSYGLAILGILTAFMMGKMGL
jgi:hypothetical protein